MEISLDSGLESRLKQTFQGLSKKGALHTQPNAQALSRALNKLLDSSHHKVTDYSVDFTITKLFVTAAIEVWQRGIHSFLVSSSLTKTSPIWASVSGYYASHYCIRGFAHLLGYVNLHNKGFTVHLENGNLCSFIKGTKGEHVFYWLS